MSADSITCRACNGNGISAQCCHNFFNLCTYLQLLLSKYKTEVKTVILGLQSSGHKVSKKILDPIPYETAAGNQKGDIFESPSSELRYNQILLILK